MASMNLGYLRTYTSRIQACRQFLIGYQVLNCFGQQVAQFRLSQCSSSFLPITCLASSVQATSNRYYHSELGNQPSSFIETVQFSGGTIVERGPSSTWTEKEKKRLEDLNQLHSYRDIFKFINSLENLSDKMVAAVLQQMCDVHLEGNLLKNTEDLIQNENFKALCFQLEQEPQYLSDSSLVDSLNALTKLGIDPHGTLANRLVSECQRRLDKGHMSIRNLCVLGESLFNLEGSASIFLQQVMDKIQSISLEDWKVDEIAMVYKMLQLYAGNTEKCRDLLRKMNTFTVTQVFQFSPTLTSIILNALVVLEQTQALPLVIKLCKHSVRQIPHFTNDELVSVLEAFVYFGYNDGFFTKALEKHVAEGAFIMHPSVVSTVMQYCSKKHILSERIFNAVAESFIYNADNFTTAQITEQIVPFGKLNYLPPCSSPLFRKLERILSTRFAQFQPRVLLNLLHSFILVERYPLNFLAKVFSPYFLQQLQAEEPGLEKSILSQLTQLYLAVRLECPSYEGPELLPQYRVKSFLTSSDHSVESSVETHFYKKVKAGLTDFLGTQKYFASKVLTPFCYTLDIEIKVDEEGFLLPSSTYEDTYRSIALCIDDQKRFCANCHHLLGKEAIKQRHLKLVGYDVVQIPFFEFELLKSRSEIVDYLHKKIFPNSYRLSW